MTWAIDALKNSLSLVNGPNETQLRQDLSQIANFLDEIEQLPQRHPDGDYVIDLIYESTDEDDLNRALSLFCETYRIKNYAFNVEYGSVVVPPRTRLITNYPEAWIQKYIKQNYFFVDPVMRYKTDKEIYFWKFLQELYCDPISSDFWKSANKHGVSINGATIQTNGSSRERFQFHLSSDDLYELFKIYYNDFLVIAKCLSDQFTRLFIRAPNIEKIGPKHIEFLKLYAAGSEVNSLELVFGSALSIEKSIHEALGTNTMSQAIIAAERLGILKDVPFAEGELVSTLSAGSKISREPE